MKIRRLIFAAAVVMGFVAPSFANTLTFQGVTFETAASGNMLTLTIKNALNGGTGNWADVQFIKAFELKDIGDVTGATLAGWNVNLLNGVASASGCTNGTNIKGACFYQSTAMQLTDLMTFSIAFTGNNLNFDAPSLKVQFLTNLTDANKTGSLLSQTIPAIPEPEIYAMLAIGLGVLGWGVHRKKSKNAAAAR